jgi:hypothetical protein
VANAFIIGEGTICRREEERGKIEKGKEQTSEEVGVFPFTFWCVFFFCEWKLTRMGV